MRGGFKQSRKAAISPTSISPAFLSSLGALPRDNPDDTQILIKTQMGQPSAHTAEAYHSEFVRAHLQISQDIKLERATTFGATHRNPFGVTFCLPALD